MFAAARRNNALMTWLLRLVGFLMMYFGLSMVFRPLSVLGDVLPILGDIIGLGTGFVAGTIALVCSLVTIAIAWLFYRPVLAVILIAVAGFFVWKLIMRRNAKKAKAAQAA